MIKTTTYLLLIDLGLLLRRETGDVEHLADLVSALAPDDIGHSNTSNGPEIKGFTY